MMMKIHSMSLLSELKCQMMSMHLDFFIMRYVVLKHDDNLAELLRSIVCNFLPVLNRIYRS